MGLNSTGGQEYLSCWTTEIFLYANSTRFKQEFKRISCRDLKKKLPLLYNNPTQKNNFHVDQVQREK